MTGSAATALLLGAAAAASFAMVETVRRITVRRGLYDPVTHRSSHTRPTPRLGGIGIVITIFIGGTMAAMNGAPAERRRLLVLLAATVLISAISLIDDLKNLRARTRLPVHFAAAAIVLTGCGYWRALSIPDLGVIPLGWLGAVVTAVWIVGVTNAFNFMDGIDGIAGGQAVVASAGWAILAMRGGLDATFWLSGIIGAAAIGFLALNWPPARIFMGDVASAAFGFLFASLPLVVSPGEGRLAVPAALMLWPFLFDTTFTFFRRLRRGEDVFEAHRSHLYQRLVIAGRSHAQVTTLYILLAAGGVAAALRPSIGGLIAVVAAAAGLWGLVVFVERR